MVRKVEGSCHSSKGVLFSLHSSRCHPPSSTKRFCEVVLRSQHFPSVIKTDIASFKDSVTYRRLFLPFFFPFRLEPLFGTAVVVPKI